MNRVAAVVVTFNRLEMLKQCLNALLGQNTPCDIILVDNASTDGTDAWAQDFARQQSRVTYYNTGENIGGAGGFNYGMRKAVEQGYELVWIMDDDCLPRPDSLEKLLAADARLDGNYGYLSSVVLWTDGTECKMNRQKIRKSYYEYAHLLKSSLVQVEQSTFVSLMFPAKTIRKVGLPIKEFFIWGDDIEYTRRITVRTGLPSFMVTGCEVIHAMKENSGSSISTDSPERIDRYRYAFRNEAYLYRKEGVKGICYYLAKCGLNFCRILTKAPNHRMKRIGILIGSMLKGACFRPDIEYLESGNE